MPLRDRLGTFWRFTLERSADPTGVSGPGVVAVGVQLPSGRCVLEWAEPAASIVVHASAAEVLAIHGHDGATAIRWIDGMAPPTEQDVQRGAAALAFVAWVQTTAPDVWARWQAGPEGC